LNILIKIQEDLICLKKENYKRGRKKKKPEYFIGRKQLHFYLENAYLTIDEIAKNNLYHAFIVISKIS